ncbi:photosynthetic complex putative assembly protein PuhB [Afifella pfennigii]|uniref:photosynthetic complex putative assembly protein PuhB n=1 Tax=Afifella pfennigii TaxID=209897 RepID=UPI00068F2D50|nr:photosynthetic complex putative assembly protein PuhB [Afifella pfennigii]
MNEFDSEPIRGVPGKLPEGERVLWQGEPRRGLLARRAFHLPTLTLYFGILLALRIGTVLGAGGSLADAAIAGSWLLTAAVVALGIFYIYGVLIARTSVYTITNRRLVFRSGLAVPLTINIPFNEIEAAAVKTYNDRGDGEIVLTLLPGRHIGYFPLWPHARPWKIKRPEPMLRAIADAARVAEILSEALAKSAADSKATEESSTETSKGESSQKWQSQATEAAA